MNNEGILSIFIFGNLKHTLIVIPVKAGIQVIKKIDVLPMVPIQKNKLVHILINLIKNAKESMQDTAPNQRKLTIVAKKTDHHVYIRFSDSGKGIESSRLNKIFTHGFTTKKDGHGFGLHSCANYMSEMRGRIWAESEGINKGATFVLEFKLPDELRIEEEEIDNPQN